MRIQPETQSGKDLYFLISGLILPRPIAWVSSRSPEGHANLAPFSFFTGVSSKPPTLCFCVGNRRDGSLKDTARNILETKEFVINLTSASWGQAMVDSSLDPGPEGDEFRLAGIPEEPAEMVNVPRVKGVSAHLECGLHQHVEIKSAPI